MKLVIAEMPSVAQSQVKAIGTNKCQDSYLEGGGCLVSWFVSHRLELSAPKHFAKRRLKRHSQS